MSISCCSRTSATTWTVNWGASGSGLISVEYMFQGESAHAAGAPWRGRSALDAVELMDVGWNFRREHLRLQQRSHYVIPNGGDQPNVVPSNASVWYFFREMDYPHIKELWEIGDKMAQGATLMTNTTFTSRVLGSAWPGHFNRPIAEDMYENIKRVGMPTWSDDDQKLAKALQKELKVKEEGLPVKLSELQGRTDEESAWAAARTTSATFPGTCRRSRCAIPPTFPNLPGHNWSNAIAMATPIAHKGVVAGAKVQAMTMLDILTQAGAGDESVGLLQNVQTKETQYTPLIRPEDKPAIWLNQKIMAEYRRADEEVLLQSGEVQNVPGAVGHQVSDCPLELYPTASELKAQRKLDKPRQVGLRLRGRNVAEISGCSRPPPVR